MSEESKMIYSYHYDSPIGTICIENDSANITGVYLQKNSNTYKTFKNNPSQLTLECVKQLSEYFNGSRKEFSLPLSPQGTVFRRKVWQALTNIPYGETRTYGDIARQIDSPKACRAVGGANNKNPIMIIIPCHRVIGHRGDLVGYACGINIKKFLLELEKTHNEPY